MHSDEKRKGKERIREKKGKIGEEKEEMRGEGRIGLELGGKGFGGRRKEHKKETLV